MYRWFVDCQARSARWHHLSLDFVMAIFLAVVLIAAPALADMRLQERSLYINSSAPGDTTFYRLSFKYMGTQPVGSVELLFCDDPIPYNPCVKPKGMNVSNARLVEQAGETGFTIANKSTNRIVLTRIAQLPTDPKSSYTLANMVNPTSTEQAFSIRIKTHASADASGPHIDFGTVRSQVIEGIELTTQVPPMLIFCLAQQVADNCASTDEIYYRDMGQLNPADTLTAQSQMAVGTNASAGFVIVAEGGLPSAGTNVINSPTQPALSQKGTNQFGINLVANSNPSVGNNPEGNWTNAIVAPGYDQPNRYKYQTGDIVAYSPNVSLMRKFTVSYILNSSPKLRAGVYSTTINFIATGRF